MIIDSLFDELWMFLCLIVKSCATKTLIGSSVTHRKLLSWFIIHHLILRRFFFKELLRPLIWKHLPKIEIRVWCILILTDSNRRVSINSITNIRFTTLILIILYLWIQTDLILTKNSIWISNRVLLMAIRINCIETILFCFHLIFEFCLRMVIEAWYF